jgi:hypothetical protein
MKLPRDLLSWLLSVLMLAVAAQYTWDAFCFLWSEFWLLAFRYIRSRRFNIASNIRSSCSLTALT